MITREQYLKAIEVCKQYTEQSKEDIKLFNFKSDFYDKNTKLRDMDISVRLHNLLRCYFDDHQYNQTTALDLKNVPLHELTKMRRFGKMMIIEFKELISKIE